MTSRPYRGDGSKEVAKGDFSGTQVGDESDTSPYPDPNPVIGISTAEPWAYSNPMYFPQSSSGDELGRT